MHPKCSSASAHSTFFVMLCRIKSALLQDFGVQRAESYGSSILSPLAQQRLAAVSKPADAAVPPEALPQTEVEYTSDDQFASRVELYRGRYVHMCRNLGLLLLHIHVV